MEGRYKHYYYLKSEFGDYIVCIACFLQLLQWGNFYDLQIPIKIIIGIT